MIRQSWWMSGGRNSQARMRDLERTNIVLKIDQGEEGSMRQLIKRYPAACIYIASATKLQNQYSNPAKKVLAVRLSSPGLLQTSSWGAMWAATANQDLGRTLIWQAFQSYLCLSGAWTRNDKTLTLPIKGSCSEIMLLLMFLGPSLHAIAEPQEVY